MMRDEFINWLKSLGFSKAGDEYLIRNRELFGPKLYFTVDDFDIRLYFSNFTDSMSFGSILGHFKLNSIDDNERQVILEKCIDVLFNYFDEVPYTFKKNLRDSKIKNILRD